MCVCLCSVFHINIVEVLFLLLDLLVGVCVLSWRNWSSHSLLGISVVTFAFSRIIFVFYRFHRYIFRTNHLKSFILEECGRFQCFHQISPIWHWNVSFAPVCVESEGRFSWLSNQRLFCDSIVGHIFCSTKGKWYENINIHISDLNLDFSS